MALLPAIGWLVSYPLALALTGLLLIVSLLVEAARRWWPWLNGLMWRLLPGTFRAWEGRRLLGSTWFVIGALPTLLLFGRDAGGSAVLFLAWGDPAAELVGVRWGGSTRDKTLVGSMACLLACLLAGLVGVGLGGLSPWEALAGAIVATAVERWSPPPDDNVWIPVLSGLAIVAIQYLV
jgi:dolichol kinase